MNTDLLPFSAFPPQRPGQSVDEGCTFTVTLADGADTAAGAPMGSSLAIITLPADDEGVALAAGQPACEAAVLTITF